MLPLTFVDHARPTTWTDVVNRVVHAPACSSTLLDVDDFAPGGNGDGVIQAGETFDLVVYFKNYGTGAADGLQRDARLERPDVDDLHRRRWPSDAPMRCSRWPARPASGCARRCSPRTR